MLRKSSLLLLASIIIAVIINCGASKPGWINKGGGYFSAAYGKAFYGIGAVSNINNVGLRRNSVDAQARADLARVFKTHVQDLVKIYSRSVLGNPDSGISEEQFVQQSTKALTEIELSGAMIVERYYDKKNKTEYALAKLDMAMFKTQLNKVKELSKEVREIIEKNAESAFDELKKQVKK